MGFEAFGYRFATRSAALRYRWLVLEMERLNVDPLARLRMGSRFIDQNGGV